LKLYEERLVANKSRVKTGEVSVGKHVETQTARVTVPVEKERVIIERTTPNEAGRTVSSAEANFREGEVTRMGIYEETPDIQKEAVLREEVKIKKVVEQDTVEAEGTVRREELDVNTNDERLHERKS
ncbi:MAG: YsnF/AvaK domain-containing protein, partial [Nostoc sp.]